MTKNLFVILNSLISALILFSCNENCDKYDKIYDGFPYTSGQSLKFRTSDGDTFSTTVDGPHILLDKYSATSGKHCLYANQVTWKMNNNGNQFEIDFRLGNTKPSPNSYIIRILTPYVAEVSEDFYTSSKLNTLEIANTEYNDIFNPSKGLYSAYPGDSVWFSRSYGLVKLKYNGKTYERII